MSLATSLYDALTGINIPKDQAREVVEALDQKMTNEVATKSDIALVRAEISALRTEMHAEIAALRSEMRAEVAALRAEIAALRSEMHAEIAALRAEMKAEIAELRAEMKAEIAELRQEMKSLENRLLIKLGALIVIMLGVLPEIRSWL
jgi:phage host-nuclease inhibitor protein Gam